MGSDLDDESPEEELELVDDVGVIAKLRSAIAQINFRPVKLDILRKQVTLWQQATGQTVRELKLKRDCITRYGQQTNLFSCLKNTLFFGLADSRLT